MKNYIFKTIALGTLALSVVACGDDFLDRVPQSSYVADNFFASEEALQAVTAPLYGAAWFDYNVRPSVQIGTARANDFLNPWFGPEFLVFNVTPLNGQLASTWKAFYATITMSNSVIESINARTSGTVTEESKNAAIAEARLMRGLAYFYLVRIWNDCIIFENNMETVNHPQQPLRTGYDGLTFAIRDFTYAAEHLPESAKPGRATCWSAKALLAKAYLTRSGWNALGGSRDTNDLEMCKKVALEVIEESGLHLLPYYGDLFTLKGNNNEEALLQMQWVENGTWGTQNTLMADIGFSSKVTGGVNVWGGGNGSIDQLKLYEKNDSIRLKETFFVYGFTYKEINKAEGGYVHTSKSCPIKKGIIGGSEDNDGVYIASMNYPLNTYHIRLADTYLTYAEACLGNAESLSDGLGLLYFNEIRKRAGVGQKSSITLDDIIKERRIEFCLEHCNWYDMTTWFRWKPEKMVDYMMNQHRGEYASQYMRGEDGLMHFYDGDGVEVEWGNSKMGTVINITADNIFLPYPENDVLQNPKLKEAPIPYEFTEE